LDDEVGGIHGIHWLDNSLWINSGSWLKQLSGYDDIVTKSYFSLPDCPSSGFARGLAWDGDGFWTATPCHVSEDEPDKQKLYKISKEGDELLALDTPAMRKVSGIAWDGSSLWVVYRDSPETIAHLNALGSELNAFEFPASPGCGGTSWSLGSERIAWGDDNVFAVTGSSGTCLTILRLEP